MSLKSTNKVDTNRHELEITVDGATFETAVQKAYRKNISKMNIPGFRKGHAPRGIVEKMFGKDVFYDDALNDIYPDVVEAAIIESGLDVIEDKIDFELVSCGADGVDFKIKVTVKPEVELGEYKGLKAEKEIVKVTDDEVNAEISRLQDRNSRVVSVDGRAAANGDITVIDFDGYVDGKAFEGGKAEGFSLELGSGQFIPGFEEQVIGHSVNDEFDVNVTFPEDYQAEELAGKPAVFKIKLHEVKTRELPAVDDEFAKDVSEFNTVDELKADISKKLLDKKTEAADNDVEGQLISGILEGFSAEIPAAMIENRISENVRDFEYRLNSQGLKLDDYMKYTGSDEKAFRDGFREAAERQVKVRLALEKIAQLENIKPTAEELAAEYDKLKEAYNADIERIKAAIPEKEISADLSVGKAIELVKSAAVISDVEKKTAESKEKATEKKTAAKKPATKKAAAPKKTKAEKSEKAE